ncbi:MAG: YraN family protein [Candidatus Eisenbacteria sp.]|nr:YraN family protein [Candidatus Eisenbacteria bacterium]
MGRRGEEAAVRHLEARGYRIIERNYRWHRAEIDVIAQHRGVLIFIEVKARRGEKFGSPERAVDQRKQSQIARVAAHYLRVRGLEGTDCRFDVLALMEAPDSSGWFIDHIQDAFWIEKRFVV